MKRESKGWTVERRKKQAENIRRVQPWRHSTGPKSAAGKARARDNSLKHAAHSQAARELHEIMRVQRLFVSLLKATLPLE